MSLIQLQCLYKVKHNASWFFSIHLILLRRNSNSKNGIAPYLWLEIEGSNHLLVLPIPSGPLTKFIIITKVYFIRKWQWMGSDFVILQNIPSDGMQRLLLLSNVFFENLSLADQPFTVTQTKTLLRLSNASFFPQIWKNNGTNAWLIYLEFDIYPYYIINLLFLIIRISFSLIGCALVYSRPLTLFIINHLVMLPATPPFF